MTVIGGKRNTFSALSPKAQAFVSCMEVIQLWRHDYLLGMPLFVYLEHLSAETEQALREQGSKGGGAWFPGVISKVRRREVTVDKKVTKEVVSQVTVLFEDNQRQKYSNESIIIDDDQEPWGDGDQACCNCTRCVNEAAELIKTDSQEEVEKKAPVRFRLRGWTGFNTMVTDEKFNTIVTDKKFLTSFSGRFGTAAVMTERAESVNLSDREENEREHGSADEIQSDDSASGADEMESKYPARQSRRPPLRYSGRE